VRGFKAQRPGARRRLHQTQTPTTAISSGSTKSASDRIDVNCSAESVSRDAREAEERAASGAAIDVPMRIRNRRDHAYCAKLAAQAATAVFEATGGAGLMLDSPIQRAWRDTHAIARHISLNWDGVSAMYGQHRLGLEPRGQY